MAKLSRYYTFTFPEGSDSVFNALGLAQIQNFFDHADLKLNAIQAGGVTPSEGYIGCWVGSSTQSLASGTTIVNASWNWSLSWSAAGSIAPGFTTPGGLITFPTSGYYRLTYHILFVGAGTWSEGYVRAGLKTNAGSTFITRASRQEGNDTKLGENRVQQSVLLRAASTGGDVDLTTSYNIGVVQVNSSAAASTVGGSTTWVTIEYVRPL